MTGELFLFPLYFVRRFAHLHASSLLLLRKRERTKNKSGLFWTLLFLKPWEGEIKEQSPDPLNTL